MLYTQIRYAEEIRALYRLRHMLGKPGSPEIHSKLGFSRYNEQLRRIKNSLKREHVLNHQGRFVETEPNIWLARLPLVIDREKTKALGHRIPYSVFMALVNDPRTSVKELPKELRLDAHSTSMALDRMSSVGIIKKNADTATPDHKLSEWLLGYIDLAKAQAKATGDISYLFRAIPSYIAGPRAFYDRYYEPGRPIAPADMVVATYEPYMSIWEAVLLDVPYFHEYAHRVTIQQAGRFNVVWVNDLPYARRARPKKRRTL